MTCNNCGKQVAAGVTTCQFCGASLAAIEGSNSRLNAQEQPAIPAWLESLRANERPGTPASGTYSFSSADLIDEDDLPGWMRPDSAELAKKSDSNKYPAVRPSWMPAPNTDTNDSGVTPTGRLSASSLINSASLPAWMRPALSSPPEPLSAASLVEPESLPSWMTTPQGQTYQPVQPSQSPAAPFQDQPMRNPASAFPVPVPAQASPAFPVSQPNSATWQEPPMSASSSDPSGISASSLLDMQALPEWLRSGGQTPASQPGQGPASGLSAGSLIDVNALPAWLRTAEQTPQNGYGSPAMQGNSGVYGSSGTSPRIESMRVPNRPRAEMAPLEQSEVAANVFSSMLGVASNSPAYPTTPAGDFSSMQQNFQGQPSQYSPEPRFAAPQYAAPFTQHGEMGMQQPSAPAVWGGESYQPVQPGSQQGLGQNAPNMYGAYPGAPDSGQVNIQQNAQAYQAPAMTPGAKPSKRGFFETIREWFHL